MSKIILKKMKIIDKMIKIYTNNFFSGESLIFLYSMTLTNYEYNFIYLELILLTGIGLLHGSSKSHWLRKKTSNKPINNINDEPPHVDANVGPDVDVNGQLQLIYKKKFFLSLFNNICLFNNT